MAIPEDTSNANILNLIGHSYAENAQFRMAIPYFLNAINKDQTKNAWIYELSLLYYALKEDSTCLKYMLLAADQGYPRDADFSVNLALTFMNLRNLNQGLAVLNDLPKNKAGDFELLNMVAGICFEKGHYRNAIGYWEKILETDNNNAISLYMIGLSLQKIGELEKGRAYCAKALKINPTLSTGKTLYKD